MAPPATLTLLLQRWRDGDSAAEDALLQRVYGELRQLAGARLSRERAGHTLQPTALVNEVWMRLGGADLPDWQSRAHFFGVAARLMRQILVDHARARQAQRRQGGERVDLDLNLAADPQDSAQALEVLALHEALQQLSALDERRARVVELRYFGGLERQEIAEVLGITERMVKRDLQIAQAWLAQALSGEAPTEGEGGT